MKRTKVLLLAGGLGTRLKPLTDRVPKCLVPVGGRPMLDYWFDRFAVAGLRDVLINTHHLPDQVRTYIRNVNQTGRFHMREAWEPRLLGSAGTVAANRDWVADDELCLIVYADNLSDIDLSALLTFHQRHDEPFTMVLFHTAYPSKCGIATLDDEDRIIAFEEKPEHPKSNLANAGVYVVDGSLYRQIAEMKAFDLGFDVLPTLVGNMAGWTWHGYHRDIGTPESLAQAERDIAEVFSA
ncbi:MAG: nucleotidyltransferase family protein [Phycisphaeraceae bacterium]|nr:nucleotidyltransferase family protein [Phycisphaeraceae bacterium]